MTREVSRYFTVYCPPLTKVQKSCSEFIPGVTPAVAIESVLEDVAAKGSPADQPPRGVEMSKGQSPDPMIGLTAKKSRRIFVAKIPPNVTEEEMRKHFESYGEIEDAYRPRDFTKNTFRGIGFVTFVDPKTTDRVIGLKHKLGGYEVVVDRATPKTQSTESVKTNWSLDVRDSVKSMENLTQTSHGFYPSTMDWIQPTSKHLENEKSFVNINEIPICPVSSQKSSIGSYANSSGTNPSPPSIVSDDLTDFSPRAAAGCDSSGSGWIGVSPRNRSQPSSKAEKQSKQTNTENTSHVRKVRSGPRIFVGKLAKDTIEQDLADYFSRFGFVMDVYIPRSKENKKEHRGFGFVTFETEASIKRTVAQGTHTLKGAVLAIDVAVPESSTQY